MGNTYKPMAVSFQCMTKSTTIKKKENLCLPPWGTETERGASEENHGTGPWTPGSPSLSW